MPRYVLVEFDNNAQAEQFVTKTHAGTTAGKPYRVVGLFAKPRNFCECGPLNERLQAAEVARGSKYGWMVHIKCGRPRRQASHSPRNLLDDPGTRPQDVSAYIHLVGEWATGVIGTGLLRNYPIAVKTKETDK